MNMIRNDVEQCPSSLRKFLFDIEDSVTKLQGDALLLCEFAEWSVQKKRAAMRAVGGKPTAQDGDDGLVRLASVIEDDINLLHQAWRDAWQACVGNDPEPLTETSESRGQMR